MTRQINQVSRQTNAVPNLCCIVTRRLVESAGGVFDPILSSAIAVFVMAMLRVKFGCSSLSVWHRLEDFDLLIFCLRLIP